MKTRCDDQLQEQGLPAVKRKVLTSLQKHWAGLLVLWSTRKCRWTTMPRNVRRGTR
jgi:hypothetical protein